MYGLCGIFFFKQKTAYELRISDWSSDVCSSDLLGPLHISARHAALAVRVGLDDAGVGREPFAANELFGQATLQDLFEHESQGVVVAEPAMTVLRERRVVGYRILQAKAAEPRSEEPTSEIKSLMRISYAVYCLK